MQKLLNLIKPLISPSESYFEEDPYNLEVEQIEVSKMIFSVKSQNLEVLYEIFYKMQRYRYFSKYKSCFNFNT